MQRLVLRIASADSASDDEDMVAPKRPPPKKQKVAHTPSTPLNSGNIDEDGEEIDEEVPVELIVDAQPIEGGVYQYLDPVLQEEVVQNHQIAALTDASWIEYPIGKPAESPQELEYTKLPHYHRNDR